VGSADHMARARLQRKRLGGGWRQAGGLAAAGLHALEHHLPRTADDHEAARAFATAVADRAPRAVDVASVETNIVLLRVSGRARAAAAACEEQGVRLSVLGPDTVRAVTHLDVPADACERAGRVVGAV